MKHQNIGVQLDEKDRFNGRDRFDDKGRYDDRDQYEHRKMRNESTRFNPNLDILYFKGRMQTNDFLDWLNTTQWIFENCDPLKHKKVKLVTIKL